MGLCALQVHGLAYVLRRFDFGICDYDRTVTSATGRDLWFRSDAWDATDEEHFETRLARARAGNRPQYLFIKASVLLTSPDKRRIDAGLRLLRRVIADHSDNLLRVANAHYALGEHFAGIGQLGEAERHFRACLALEASGQVSHETELRLAELLVEHGPNSSLSEAWALLDARRTGGILFNNVAWRINVTRARLLRRNGENESAALYATAALDLIGSAPQLGRHPTVGLVNPSRKAIKAMKKLANG